MDDASLNGAAVGAAPVWALCPNCCETAGFGCKMSAKVIGSD